MTCSQSNTQQQDLFVLPCPYQLMSPLSRKRSDVPVAVQDVQTHKPAAPSQHPSLSLHNCVTYALVSSHGIPTYLHVRQVLPVLVLQLQQQRVRTRPQSTGQRQCLALARSHPGCRL
jgi:hypothetical protein